MFGLSWEMVGEEKLAAAFELLAGELDEMSRDLARECGEILLKHVKEECPESPPHAVKDHATEKIRRHKGGNLRNALQLSEVFKGEEDGYTIRIEEDDRTRTESGTHYGKFVVEGTDPHPIEPRDPDGVLVFDIQASYQNLRRKKPGPGTRPFLVQRDATRYQRKNKQMEQTIAKYDAMNENRKKRDLPPIPYPSNRVSSVAKSSTAIFARHVRHPGTAPNDFVTRGMENASPEIEAHIQARLAIILER